MLKLWLKCPRAHSKNITDLTIIMPSPQLVVIQTIERVGSSVVEVSCFE
jgi:hypothetical protein